MPKIFVVGKKDEFVFGSLYQVLVVLQALYHGQEFSIPYISFVLSSLGPRSNMRLAVFFLLRLSKRAFPLQRTGSRPPLIRIVFRNLGGIAQDQR